MKASSSRSRSNRAFHNCTTVLFLLFVTTIQTIQTNLSGHNDVTTLLPIYVSASSPSSGGSGQFRPRPTVRLMPQQQQQQQQNAYGTSTSTRRRPSDTTYLNVEEEQEDEKMQTKEAIDAFLTRDSRTTFIARVYAILSVQMVILLGSILGFRQFPHVAHWMAFKGRIVPFTSLAISTISFLAMSLSENIRRSSPSKWLLLSLFTFGESIVVGFISSMYHARTVMSALGATSLATLSVTAYTLLNDNPKRDLSQWGSALFSFSMLFLAFGFIQFLSSIGILPPNFLPYNEGLFAFAGASLFTLYLAYHTRLIVSGKHTKYQLNEKDYVFGAMLLYDDIVTIFLYLLRLFDDDRRD